MKRRKNHIFLYVIGLLFSVFNHIEAQSMDSEPALNVVSKYKWPVALKTNLLSAGAMIPTIGVEVGFPERCSVVANWFYADWGRAVKKKCWHTYGGEIEFRKWFGYKNLENEFQGHHVSSYFQAGTYDFQWKRKGYMSDFTWNVGLAYGYAFRITRDLSLDFVIGLGYVSGFYTRYRSVKNGYCWDEKNRLCYFGPSKAEISIVWQIASFYKKDRKGNGYDK